MPFAFLLINLEYCMGAKITFGKIHNIVAIITPSTPKGVYFTKNIDNGMLISAPIAKECICKRILLMPFIKNIKGE